jgi:hypothetical protein
MPKRKCAEVVVERAKKIQKLSISQFVSEGIAEASSDEWT